MPKASTPAAHPEVVTLRLPSGRLRYLLEAYQETCEHCSTGTRTVSVWISTRGQGEYVAWCRYCFNATCEPAPLNEEHQERLPAILAAVSAGRTSRPYAAARQALEDLEQQGLL